MATKDPELLRYQQAIKDDLKRTDIRIAIISLLEEKGLEPALGAELLYTLAQDLKEWLNNK